MTDEQTMRICTGCERDLPFNADLFSRDKTKPFGLSSRCRDCRSRYRSQSKGAANVISSIKRAEEAERKRLEQLAYDNACDQLVKVHPRLFANFLYSEHVRLGLVNINGRDIPADMRQLA